MNAAHYTKKGNAFQPTPEIPPLSQKIHNTIRNTRARAREAYIGAGFGVAASMSPDDFSNPADVSQPRAEEKKMPAEGRGQSNMIPWMKVT